MNLRLTDDISQYNLINQLYNILPEKESIHLKDIIGINTVISISPAGREINDIKSSQNISFCLFLMPDNEPIYVNIPAYFLCEFLSKISGKVSNCALTPAGLALIEYIFLKIILSKNGKIISRLRWSGIREDNTENNNLLLIFKLNFMDGVYFFSIGLSDKVAKELIKMTEINMRRERFSDITNSIIPVLAEGEIKICELTGIQPGDIIVFRDTYIKLYENGKKGGIIMFKTEDDELIGGYNLDTGQLFYKNEGREEKGESGKNAEEFIQNIPITLSIELKRIKIQLKDLNQLVPGQLIDLHENNTVDVLISANGKIIGTGRLVKIDDTVCVEVLTLKE